MSKSNLRSKAKSRFDTGKGWVINNHKKSLNVVLGLLTSILLGITGYVLYNLGGFPTYSLPESFIVAVLIGIAMGQDIGRALEDKTKTAFFFIGLMSGLTVILSYWVWGFNLIPVSTILSTTIVAGLHYANDIEELEFEETLGIVPFIGKKMINSDESSFRRVAGFVILFILMKGFVSVEDLVAIYDILYSTVA
ncbi:hypothetical protein [Candidatus Nanohalococcus occultus]|uniref:hypothetical protein n=1 Tax=Candidatus Nanohalococcus occultus TaxID=2978047 RepID=UPI0039E056E9